MTEAIPRAPAMVGALPQRSGCNKGIPGIREYMKVFRTLAEAPRTHYPLTEARSGTLNELRLVFLAAASDSITPPDWGQGDRRTHEEMAHRPPPYKHPDRGPPSAVGVG